MLMNAKMNQSVVQKCRTSNNNNFQSALKLFNTNSSSKRADDDDSLSLSSSSSSPMRTGKIFVEQQKCNNNNSSPSTVGENVRQRRNLKIHEKNIVEEKILLFDPSSTTTMTTVANINDQKNSSANERRRSTTIIDAIDFNDRYVSLEHNFNDYRRKTNSLLLKKDAHISRLQDRLNSFVENSSVDSTLHMIVADRDSLRVKLEQLESVYQQEKSSWLSEMESMRNCFEEKEQQILLQQNRREFFDDEEKTVQCGDCDFLRRELDRCRSELSELNAKCEQIICSNGARLDSLTKQFQIEITSKNDELKSLNDRLTSTLIERDDAMKNLEKFQLDLTDGVDDKTVERRTLSVENQTLSVENQTLKRQLYEANEYFESMDVESEQQITVLINQIDEMHEILESKQRDHVVMTNELITKNQEIDQLQQKLKSNDVQSSRQMDIIENLRDDSDKQKDKLRETLKERDDLLIRVASLTHEVDFTKRQSQKERENIHQQLTLAGQELDDYRSKLREHEMNADSTSALTNLTTKLTNLEDLLKRKQDTVDVLEQRLANVKRLLRKNLLSKSSKSEFDLNADRHPPSFQSPMKKLRVANVAGDGYEYKSAINRMFPNDNDPERIARVFGSLLRLSTDEEKLVKNFLQQKPSTQTLSTIEL